MLAECLSRVMMAIRAPRTTVSCDGKKGRRGLEFLPRKNRQYIHLLKCLPRSGYKKPL